MTKVYSSDLAQANSSAMITQLESTANSSAEASSKISSFISGSQSILMGKGYDAMRAKMSVYLDALNKSKTLCDNLSNNIRAANNIMLTFMEGYSFLDNSLIPDIENSIEDIKSFIGWLESYTTTTTTDPATGKTTTSQVRNGTDAEITHWKGILAELEKKLEKLKQLDPTDSSAFALLTDVTDDIRNFAKALYELKLPNYDGTIPDDMNSAEFKELLSEVGVANKPVFYCQKGWYDEQGKLHRWKTSWGKSIASSGCGPTSMASILATMLGDTSITPSTIANMMNYNDNVGGTYVFKACKKYGLDYDYHIGLGKNNMNEFLSNGGKMIVAVNNGGHYIAVLGYNPETGKYTVCDPNNPKKRTWSYNEIAAGHTMVFHIAPKGKTVQECI